MALHAFHPAVAAWFGRQFGRATDVQAQAWPAIRRQRHTLIAAPTGSGKTLAAFLAAIDELVREGLSVPLTAETRVLYVSPLKALSNDIQKNLAVPLAGIRDELLLRQLPDVDIRAAVRTGDTPAGERERMRRQPPHIVVTTPESLFILLSADSGRRMLKTVRSVIVDEIHALAGNKRGAHLSLSLERLATLCLQHQGRAPVRIGLSATQKPIEDMARFLVGAAVEASVSANTQAGDPTSDFLQHQGVSTSSPSPPLTPLPGEGGVTTHDPAVIHAGHAHKPSLLIEASSPPLEALPSNGAAPPLLSGDKQGGRESLRQASAAVATRSKTQGATNNTRALIDTGHVRKPDIAIEIANAPAEASMPIEPTIPLPRAPLEASISNEVASPLPAGGQGERGSINHSSAVATPVENTGAIDHTCTIIDAGHVRKRDIAIVVPGSPLEAVMSNEVWQEVYDRLEQLIHEHRTTLIFVNTRRIAERAARFLAERLGEEHVTAHHGSLSREHRLDAEQRLKAGKLRALVATASLELGIDIGDIDLVCQLGSPRAISVFLQRVGRAGHAVHATPKGRLFPLSHDELVECAALLDGVRRGELDRIHIPAHPLDVLAQQIVAEVASQECDERALFDTFRRAWPYRDLTREDYTAVVRMLADGYTTRRGRRGAYLHRDAVNGRLRARRGARLVTVTNGGAIPDLFDYDVILQPEGLYIGSLNEDFAFESLAGDIFQLGNNSYRVLKVEQGKVHAADAQGQPPTMPFWLGEAPGRSDELSYAVSRLREIVSDKLTEGSDAAIVWLRETLLLPLAAAQQLVDYLALAQAVLGVIPTQHTLVFERFFDETGDMHLVIHAPFGSRVNRAWGLALRKRFCRKFNFELQAAALEDSIVLSLGPTHSFPLAEVADYLKSTNVRQVLIQALLDAPLFETRWRWNSNIALAVPRNRNGKRVPAQWQRSNAQDLVAVIFPDQLACIENIAGEREVPDHPLVKQTLQDCLYEAMDVEGVERLLAHIERGKITIETRDLPAPSPLSQSILSARPYAFLDDAPMEERRTLAIQQRRYRDPQGAAEMGRLNPEAIAQVRAEAWPEARDADELHDALNVLAFITEPESGFNVAHWPALLDQLITQQRATVVTTPQGDKLWVVAERLAEVLALFPHAALSPVIAAVIEPADRAWNADDALREIIRSRLEGLGPVTAAQLAAPLGMPSARIDPALLALEQEGYVLRGSFTANTEETEWCERGLLARIHRYTMQQLRREVEPVSIADFMRFLMRWHHLGDARGQGGEALAAVLQQLEGYSIPAAAWEADILPARIESYFAQMLDALCGAGRFTWLRLQPPKDKGEEKRKTSPVRMTPIALLPRPHVKYWRHAEHDDDQITLSASTQKIADTLQQQGASFFIDLVQGTGMLRTQVEEGLGELAARGRATADSYAGLRALITPALRKQGYGRHARRRGGASIDEAGRWELLRKAAPPLENDAERIEHIARTLLRRYGVVFRKLLERENKLPSWRELLYIYRRMEARGDLRGGRFVQGFAGEQFALPEAVGSLRDTRKRPERGDVIVISAADPLNLVGIVTPGARVPAQAGNRIAFRDGVPAAALIAGVVEALLPLDSDEHRRMREHLIGRKATSSSAAKIAL